MVLRQERKDGGLPGLLDSRIQRRFFKEPLEDKLRGKDSETVCHSLIRLLGSRRLFIKTVRSPLRNAMNRFLVGYETKTYPGLQIIVEDNPEYEYILPTFSLAGKEPGKIIIPDNFPDLLAVNPEQQTHSLIESVCSLVNPRKANNDEYLENRIAEFDGAVSYITAAWDITEVQKVTGALANKLEIW